MILLLFEKCLRKAAICTVIGFSFRDIPIREIFRKAYEENSALRIKIVAPNPNQGSISEFVTDLQGIESSRIDIEEMKFGQSDRYVEKMYRVLELSDKQ